jgi:hypothetical protein
MSQQIKISVAFGSTTRSRTFHGNGRADQWIRKLAKRGWVGDSGVVVTQRGRDVQIAHFGEHPVVQEWREDAAA